MIYIIENRTKVLWTCNKKRFFVKKSGNQDCDLFCDLNSIIIGETAEFDEIKEKLKELSENI